MVSCAWERMSLYSYVVNVKKRSKEKTIGPCPCELCSRFGTVRREKRENWYNRTVVWIGVRSSGCRCTGFIFYRPGCCIAEKNICILMYY